MHLCGKRYVNRVEDVTKVTVYSNQPEVELFVNGVSVGKKTAPDHFFYFEVKNEGESTIVAKAGDLTDEGKLCKVEVFDEQYRLKEQGAILNWFDIDAPEGRFSLNDKISDIMSTLRGKLWLLRVALKLKKAMSAGKDKKKKNEAGGFEITKDMMQMIGGFTVPYYKPCRSYEP